MGVHGLWTLLEPVGRRIDIQAISNKRLAVDASIWLYQFIRAMRTPDGEMMKNAHLLGFFRRICKLLFHKVQPIFVFEGTVPALKRQTIAARHARRETHTSGLKRAAEKLVINQIKRQALLEAQRQRQQKRQQKRQQDDGADDSGGAEAAGRGRHAKRRKADSSTQQDGAADSSPAATSTAAAAGGAVDQPASSAAAAAGSSRAAAEGGSSAAAWGLPASSSGGADAAAARGVDVRQLPDGELEELQVTLTLEASAAAAADPKGKWAANQAAEALQQQVEQELQRRQAARAGTGAAGQAGPLSHRPAAAAGGDDVDQLTVDEQLARELDEELNRRHKRKTDSQGSVGPRLFNFEAAAAAAAAGSGGPGSAVDDGDALLAAALAALDAEDAAAAAEAAEAQAAAAAAARGPAVKGGDKAAGGSAAGASGNGAADADEADGLLTWQHSRRRPQRACQQKRKPLQNPAGDGGDSSSEGPGSGSDWDDSDPEQQQQQQDGKQHSKRARRQKQLTPAQQQQKKLLGALARRTQRQQQQQGSAAAGGGGDAEWVPDDEAEEDEALLGFRSRVGAGSDDDDSDSDGGGGELLLPADVSNLDPAVLSTLPQSVQLDILEKMRDAQQTANREKFLAAAASAPKNFSQVQMEAYLKASRFRQTIEQHKRAMGGGTAMGPTPAGQQLQGRKLASEHTREFIFARQQPQAPSAALLSGGFMTQPSQQQQQQQPGFSGPTSPKPKRRRKVERLLEDMREAERNNPRSGFKVGVVPKGGLEGLKGLAAFTSVLKAWGAAEEQQEAEAEAAELGLGPEAAAAAAGLAGGGQDAAVKLEQDLTGPVPMQLGSQGLTGAAGGASTTALPALNPPSIPAASGAVGPPGRTAAPAPADDGAAGEPGVQLQLRMDGDVSAADAAMFGGMGLSSSEEEDDHTVMPPGGVAAAAAPGVAAGVGAVDAAGGQDSSEDWEDVEPVLPISATLQQQQEPMHQQQQQQQQQQQEPMQQQQQQEEGQAAAGQPSGWRDRMALRQKFWSTSHGFKLGRKLGDWSVAEQLAASQDTATPPAGLAPATAGAGAGGAGVLPAAAAGGVVAAVIGGAVGRSPVKPQVARRIGQLQSGRGHLAGVLQPEVAGVLGSDDEADAELQAAIQLSLAEAGTQPVAGVLGSARADADGHARTVSDGSEDWEDVMEPQSEAPAAAPSPQHVPTVDREPQPLAHQPVPGGNLLQEQQSAQARPSSAHQQTPASVEASTPAPSYSQPEQQLQQQEGPEGRAGELQGSCSGAPQPAMSSGAASLAALYNGRSKLLLEQLPAAAPSRPEDVAAIRRDLLAGADAASAQAHAREYPVLQEQQEQQQPLHPEQPAAQQHRPEHQPLSQPQQQRLPGEAAAASLPPAVVGLQGSSSGAVNAAGPPAGAGPVVAGAADFSFMDEKPSSRSNRQRTSPAASDKPPLGLRADRSTFKLPSLKLGSRLSPQQPEAPVQDMASQQACVDEMQGQQPSTHKQHQQRLHQQPPGQQQEQERERERDQQEWQQQEQQELQQQQQDQQQQQIQERELGANVVSLQSQAQPAAAGTHAMPPPRARLGQQKAALRASDAAQSAAKTPQPGTEHPTGPEQQPLQLPAEQLQAAGSTAQDQQPRSAVDIDAELANLAAESSELRSRLTTAARNTATPTQDMIAECQELLTLFGLPYITAPAEAEAQCAWLEAAGLVDGVVTDDNDAFLFGAQHLYRHMFEDKKYVEEYHMSDIERELGVDRGRLVCLAMLLGSDYTEGVAGIGVVNALEVVSAWPDGLAGLAGFKQWMESPDERILAAATAALQAASEQQGDMQQQQQQEKAAEGSKQKGRARSGAKVAKGRTGAAGGSSRGRGGRGRKGQAGRQLTDAAQSEDTTDLTPEGDCHAAGTAAAPNAGVPSGGEDSQQQTQAQVLGATNSKDTPAQRRFKTSHRGVVRSWSVPVSFPNSRVHEAYIKPLVDRNPAKFNFGRPNQELLMQFCREYFGWDTTKADDLLRPVLSSYAERSTQLRIDQFLTHKQRFAKIRSKRLQQAVTAIVAATGSDVNPELFYASTDHMPDLQPHSGVLAKEPEGGEATQLASKPAG